MDCPRCYTPMQVGVSHDDAYTSQWECPRCGYIEPKMSED